MKKLLIISGMALVLITALGFSFSNYIRPLGNPTLNEIDIAAYDYKNNLSAAERAELKAQIVTLAGVKAVRVGSTNITVTMDAEQTDRYAVESSLKTTVDENIGLRVYTGGTGKSCPITGPDSFGQKIAKIFRF